MISKMSLSSHLKNTANQWTQIERIVRWNEIWDWSLVLQRKGKKRKKKGKVKAVSVESFWPVQTETALCLPASVLYYAFFWEDPTTTRNILQDNGPVGLQQSIPLDLHLVAMAEVKNDQGIDMRSNQSRNS